MRNAVIRKRAMALRALRGAPLRLVLGTAMSETDLASLRDGRLWVVPTPSFGTFK